ncbi:MAG: bifunctional UDP-N-acetylglucosamine diphosphorylase/glucosamine-1-phosphate N-acetyltransferase GlmU [Paracoccaceae bacterium]|nr:bifunctional UDP-N-acetylglucosamine diphosphorylase/glucosamine-1-phosphate N-acetyltransferase GlmU [Paracoccaceae bacterium]
MTTNVLLLAAGEGSRMLSDTPKVLHELAGAPLFQHALSATADLDGRRVIVIGHGGDAVRKAADKLDERILFAEQTKRLGTAHAVTTAAEALAGAGGDTLILYGDTPFIRAETIRAMQDMRSSGADIVFLGFEAADPARYGRLVKDGDRLVKIVEYADASMEERAITLCNSGVVLAETETLLRLAAAVGNNNAAGEYYLTDLPVLGASEGIVTKVAICDEAETLGINSRADLAEAEAVFQQAARTAALENGVTLVAPETVHFAHDTVLGRDAVVEQFVVFGPGVTVESGARIRAFSHLEGAHVSRGAIVGPYARLRPGAELSNDARIGNFVEVKNAQIGEGSKVNHLSYIGDAAIGDGSNIGAGTITCNYDGVFKHRTEIGKDVFIGSSTMLVAPVRIGDEAMTASGSVITKDVPAGDMGVGRGRQENKNGFARKLFARLRAAKAAEKG